MQRTHFRVSSAEQNKIEFAAKYCYIIFDKNSFLFCMDFVVSKNPKFRVAVPAQYLYEKETTIQEYLSNLSKVRDKLGTEGGSPFREPENWPFVSGFIEDKFDIEKLKAGVKFSGTGKLMRHPLGEFVGLAPIPNFRDPTIISEHGIVVGTLENCQQGCPPLRRPTQSVLSALEELTRILWRDGGLSTWIMGQPGTGKEVFAQALHHGSGRAIKYDETELEKAEKVNFENAAELMKLTDGFAVQSIAGVTLEEFNNRLYAVSKDANGHCVMDVIDRLNGTIFLDEFDKPEKHFLLYSALLRVLEAGKYLKRAYLDGDGRVKETPSSCKNVNWIFAGAFTQIDPRMHVPFDLWSRLKGFIQLRNPLEDEKDINYGATLFLYWYLRLVSGILEHGNLGPLMEAVSRIPDQRSYREHVACILLGQRTQLVGSQSFLPSSELQDFASHFQRLLIRKTKFSGDRLDSPRGIFKATEAAFNFLREKVFHGEALPLSNIAIRDAALEAAHDSLRLSRGPS